MSPLPATERREVFLYGYYGCGNLGDELLLSATADGILQRWPDAGFRVRNLGPVAPASGLRQHMTETGIDLAFQSPGRGRLARASAWLRAADRELDSCRCLVLGGGTLLHAQPTPASLLLIAGLAARARMRGMPVIGLGVGAAHLHGVPARILARLVRTATTDLAVRDEASLALLGPAHNVRLTADLVYGWWPRTVRAPAAGQGPVIAVTLWSNPPAHEPAVLSAIAEALACRAAAGCRIRFLVCQDADGRPDGLSDRTAIERVQAILMCSGAASEVVRPSAEPHDLARAFAGTVVHCGARFHAAVVASLLGLPSVGLSDDPKVSSLCRELGMPHRSPAGLTGESLTDAIAEAESLRPDAARIERLRERSARNFAWFDTFGR